MQQESGLPLADSNSDPRRFPCTQCGASLEYAPGTEVQRCTYCGHENRIAVAPASIRAASIATAVAPAATSSVPRP